MWQRLIGRKRIAYLLNFPRQSQDRFTIDNRGDLFKTQGVVFNS